tara:strand:- start:1062 stop:2075 length:1014 start_codon:yes stop_codon:yes gene_type:complete
MKLKKKYSIYSEKIDPYVSLFPSGMNAIDSAFQVLMINNKWKTVNIIYGSELYCDTPRTIKYLSHNYIETNLIKINVSYSDKDILNIISKNIRKEYMTIFFIESCSNPNGNIFNFSLLKEIKKIAEPEMCKIIVDNTWLTSSVFNPFIFKEVDIVVNSLTKYYGAGQSGIMGTIICKDEELGTNIANYGKIKGLHVCPRYCAELSKNLDNLDERIRKISNMTLKIAEYLSKKVPVNYPKLENNPSYTRAIEYYGKLGPGVLTFEIPLNKKDALNWMRNSNKFKCLTSFGAPDSRFDQWPQSKKKNNKYYSTCRLSIGYEDNYESIIEELDKMLSIYK